MTPAPPPPREHTISFRVRYGETDGQGRVHHANFINYFETGRIEFLRAWGYDYRQLESSGILLVVSELAITYHRPAFFDDWLSLTTAVHRARGARIEHHYRLLRADEPIVEGKTVIACIDRAGRPRRLPPSLQFDRPAPESSPSRPPR